LKQLRSTPGALVWIAALLLPFAGLDAHHGSAGYRSDKVKVIQGAVVTKFMWVNPHSFLMFDAKEEDGSLMHWSGEAGSPAALRSVGWDKSAIHTGDVITVYIYESKFERRVGLLSKIVFANGTTLVDSPRADGGSIYRY
jgi:hypothetical protein